jgi:hypothetical protein
MGRELIPTQTATPGRRTSPSRGELLRVLRRLRVLCGADSPHCSNAMRAYRITRSLTRSRASHLIDLRL